MTCSISLIPGYGNNTFSHQELTPNEVGKDDDSDDYHIYWEHSTLTVKEKNEGNFTLSMSALFYNLKYVIWKKKVSGRKHKTVVVLVCVAALL